MVANLFHTGRTLLSGTAKSNASAANLFKIQYRGLKACVLGAMGSVGQPLSLMVKQSQWFEELALYDLTCCRGLAFELNHIDTPCIVTAYGGDDGLKQALKGSNMVLNVAGKTAQEDMPTRSDLFKTNANAILQLSKQCALQCPQAYHLILSNPVNSLVPLICEAYKKTAGSVDPSRIFGVTSIDLMRASTFVADATHTPPETVKVPVIGGHSGSTMVPLLSKTEPCVSLTTEETLRITRAVQYAGEEVWKAKEKSGSATLSVAYGTMRLAENLARAMFGEQGITDCAYVMSNLIPDVKYFSSPLILGPTGILKILPLPDLNNYESCLLQSAIGVLKKDIEIGEEYVLK